MFSYEFYKVLHLSGLILTFTGLVGIFMVRWNSPELKKSVRLLGALTHGIGLLIILVSGFGLAARLGLFGGLPGWVYAKIAIWIIVGFLMFLVKRKSNLGWPLYIIIVSAGFAAAYIAVNKPF